MQSKATLAILFLVIGLVAAKPDSPNGCPGFRRQFTPCFESIKSDYDTIEIYNGKGSLCLTARFDIDVIFDSENLVEESFQRMCRFHVRTEHYEGICEGESAVLAGENVTGPAVVFKWDETNEVLIRWKIDDGKTILNEIKIRFKVPVNNNEPSKYLYAKLSDLNLFPTDVGKTAIVEDQGVKINFKDSSKGCLIFEDTDYTFSETNDGLSVVTVVILALVLGIMMALGVLYYQKGSRKRIAKGHTLQT